MLRVLEVLMGPEAAAAIMAAPPKIGGAKGCCEFAPASIHDPKLALTCDAMNHAGFSMQ